MWRRVITTVTLGVGWALTVFPAIAQAPSRADLRGRTTRIGTAAGFQTTDSTALSLYIGTVIKGALTLVGTIFLAQMVWAGYLWMTAAGEEDQITKAKNIIRRSIVGLGIVLTAWAITFAVLDRLYTAVG